MKKPLVLIGALVGALLTAPLMGVLYFASQLVGLAFAPFDLFDWLRDRLPGGVLSASIEALVRALTALGLSVRTASKPAEFILVLGMFLTAGAFAGAIFFAIARRQAAKPGDRAGLALGAVVGLPLAIISASANQINTFPLIHALWTLAAFGGWGVAFSRVYNALAGGSGKQAAQAEAMSVERVSRRRFLIQMGAASAAITVVGVGLGSVLATRSRSGEESATEIPALARSAAQPPRRLPNADDPLVPAPGTRPEYTPLEDHYRVDINLIPPTIDSTTWTLPIIGLVERPLNLTLDDLATQYEPMDQYVTLSCISNDIGGDLIGTTRWTGVSVQKVLADASVKENAHFMNLESVDGFYESVPLDLIQQDERVMFTYLWDGVPLEAQHGFPLRIYIPDRYGMKQPKWIVKAELVENEEEGFWVERGWDPVARARATSVIDTVAVNEVVTTAGGDKLVPVGGIAWAGARGISKVEVKVDDGQWAEARLRSPLSSTTWVIWRYDWPFQAGQHTFSVRCREEDSTPQIERRTGVQPSGATGIDSMEVNVHG